jgi:hypothetical protein
MRIPFLRTFIFGGTSGLILSSICSFASADELRFATPSRNIYCSLYERGGALCEVVEHEWANWGCVDAGCYGYRFRLPPRGSASAVRSSDSMNGITKNILEYGSSISTPEVTCKSETEGLTCWNMDGMEMHLNREFFRLK